MKSYHQRKRLGLAKYNSPPLPGWHVRKTPRDWVVVELDHEADPEKRSREWEDRVRKDYQNDKEFRREFKRDWKSASGQAFYPEFEHYGSREFYIRRAGGIILSRPVVRGWDFGYRHPACVWAQYSPSQHILWVLREIMPEHIDIGDFADLVLYLSGSMGYEQLQARAAFWANVVGSRMGGVVAGYPKAPWFPPGTRFLDFGGPEAMRTSDMPSQQSQERTRAQVLASKGIMLSIHGGSVKAREESLRSLLKPRGEGLRGAHLRIDPACSIILDGLGGGIAYPKETQANPLPSDPHKDGYYEHLHDALGYLVVGHVPLLKQVFEDDHGALFEGV